MIIVNRRRYSLAHRTDPPALQSQHGHPSSPRPQLPGHPPPPPGPSWGFVEVAAVAPLLFYNNGGDGAESLLWCAAAAALKKTAEAAYGLRTTYIYHR